MPRETAGLTTDRPYNARTTLPREIRMTRGHVAWAAVAVALGVSHASIAAGQTAATKEVSAQLAAPSKGFAQPKTPWGEPDLQGVWTSDAALGIPRERPEKFGT